MKKLLIFLTSISLLFILAGCRTNDTGESGGGHHSPSHTHTGGNATCENGAVCTECGEEYGTALGHVFSGEWRSNVDGHYRECQNGCGTTDTLIPHTGGTADCENPPYCTVCSSPYASSLGHDFSGEWIASESGHHHVCKNGCDTTDETKEHVGGTPTLSRPAVCEKCGAEYGERATLDWATEAVLPANGGSVTLANNSLHTFAKEYNYQNANTDVYLTGLDHYMPNDCLVAWSVKDLALYYRLYISRNADMSGAVCIITNECSANVENLYTGCHYYWRVDAIFSEYTVRSEVFSFTTDADPRAMSVDGVSNVRDIGGYITEDGLRIKQGMIYRSAKRDGVTETGLYTLIHLMGIKTDLDLRAAKDATRPLGEEVGYVNVACPWYSTGENGIWANDTTKSEFAKAIKVFADEDNYPIIFHCALGRDRTGTLALVLEGLLGLDVNTLLLEYELSAFSVQGANGASSYSGLRTNILNTYNYIYNNYEGDSFSEKVATFLVEIGVTEDEIAAIRSIMLEEVE